ncbi:MAG: pyridoxamine 5'-phosphate oxidase family protein [Candidatus Polarisedimenticolaceae bacterium]|nr:pyridoxamine 5'-phosphate oxidase family protein [Candidatus Polarisedimenticolaceae bacterium]
MPLQKSREEMGLMARQLLAGSFHGVLSSQSAELEGFPFGSVVPFMLDRQARPIILLSHLAQHTKNLLQHNKCCLTLQQSADGDVQKLRRLTALAECHKLPEDEPSLVDRFLHYYPHQRPYYEELNFHFYRLQPVRFYFNSGFGSARWLGTDALQRGYPLDEAEELALLKQWGDSAIIGIDSEGVDRLEGDQPSRIPFMQPADSAEALNRQLEACL